MPTLAPPRSAGSQRRAVSVAKALGSATRAGIFEYLGRSETPATVRDVAAAFDVHPNVARTHLETLVDAGLVEAGRRKNPAGGRPANVYRARAGGRASALPTTGDLLVRLLGRLLERAGEHAGEQAADRTSLPARAYEVALGEGTRLVGHLDRQSSLHDAVGVLTEVLATYAPVVRVERAAEGWVDLAGAAELFVDVDGLRAEVAEAFARGLVCGVLAGLGTPAAAADAGVLPDGGKVWRIRTAGRAPDGAGVRRTVDTRRLHREAGVVEAMRAVTTLRRGEVLEVLTEGPGSPAAFARWADRAGHQLLGVERAPDEHGPSGIRLLIRKGR